MSRSIDHCAVVLGGLELPQGDIDGNTTLTLGLELVKHPSILERPLVHLSSFLLEPLDHTLVDTTELVDQVTGGGRLTRIDVADDHDANVNLFLTHSDSLGNKPKKGKAKAL
ncbi:hypothetical protein QQP08_025967 [Theobroma cacao]|nr:hypothetical protein QQP08_025967 [Theobroma cacao]